jgi:NAD(P)-dependent dehydrogenase (short-subunit alcohol dehydrogenase family)
MAKRVLVTGVTSGIGSAIKTLFESAGWEVVGLARHLPLDQEGFEVDLAKLEGVEPTALRASVEKGPFDAFIHVAGVWHDEEESFIGKRLHEFEWQQIAATMNVGLTSAMIISATLLETMPNAASMIFISGKFQDGGANYAFIEDDELKNLSVATKLYKERTLRDLYKRDPKTGKVITSSPAII